MDENTLNRYLRNLKFIVLAEEENGKPFEIFFGFHLPDMHSEIFEEAKKQFAMEGKKVCVQGGGKITKKDNFIVFHSTSQKYKRYEDKVVLSLVKEHSIFKESNYIFLSKAGEVDFNKVIEAYKIASAK